MAADAAKQGQNFDHIYRERLMSADQAVALIPDRARIVTGIAVSQPPALLAALARRAAAKSISGAEMYYLLSMSAAGDTILRAEYADAVRPMSLFHGKAERALDQQAAQNGSPPTEFVPCAFSQAPNLYAKIGVDTLITQVAPMDADGNFSLGTNTDYALSVARRAKRVILEVNRHMPRTLGDCMIPLSDVTAIVEHDQPLIAVPSAPRRPEDDAIGAIIAGLVEDGACLQMGIGALPDAACAALKDHRHLGIHTELMTPGLVELMRAGIVDNSRKAIHPGKSVYAFAMGDQAFYDFLHENPALEAHPVDYVNNPAVIARNPKMVSVNATIEVDLHGACNSEVMGGRQYSASGGQLDFVRGATLSEGGLSIIACHSTAAKGTKSRIVPRLSGAVTTPRNDVHIIATEYGWVDLRGLSLRQRANALIGIAHPQFREELERAAFEVVR